MNTNEWRVGDWNLLLKVVTKIGIVRRSSVTNHGWSKSTIRYSNLRTINDSSLVFDLNLRNIQRWFTLEQRDFQLNESCLFLVLEHWSYTRAKIGSYIYKCIHDIFFVTWPFFLLIGLIVAARLRHWNNYFFDWPLFMQVNRPCLYKRPKLVFYYCRAQPNFKDINIPTPSSTN